ncbi:hypothetical protein F4780DRAFT_790900 [Xylariomycetidae sp. FL0641]|nr:hypothetical protein F4780DRAFT_790900 [Xylariomycetidae sp. FL0641]
MSHPKGMRDLWRWLKLIPIMTRYVEHVGQIHHVVRKKAADWDRKCPHPPPRERSIINDDLEFWAIHERWPAKARNPKDVTIEDLRDQTVSDASPALSIVGTPALNTVGIPPSKPELREFPAILDPILDPGSEETAGYEPFMFVAICALKLHAPDPFFLSLSRGR